MSACAAGHLSGTGKHWVWPAIGLLIPMQAWPDVSGWSASEPVVMVVPPEVPNPTMERGCWIRLWDGPDFSGHSFVLVGPAEMRARDLAAISRFRRHVTSAETGPKAVAKLYPRDDFKGSAIALDAARRQARVAKELGGAGRTVSALRLACTE